MEFCSHWTQLYFFTEFQVVKKIVLLQHPLPPYTQFNSKQNKQDIIFLQQCKLSDEAQLKESSSSNRGATWQILLKMRPYYSQGPRVPVLSFTTVTEKFCHLTLHSSGWPHRMPGLAKHAFPTTGWLQSTSWHVRRCPFTNSLETQRQCTSVTAAGSASHVSSSLLCSMSWWTWTPRAQEKKAQWQQLAGAFVCSPPNSSRLSNFPA